MKSIHQQRVQELCPSGTVSPRTLMEATLDLIAGMGYDPMNYKQIYKATSPRDASLLACRLRHLATRVLNQYGVDDYSVQEEVDRSLREVIG